MLADRIRELRKEKNWSAPYLASKLGVTQAALSYYESGMRCMPVERLVRLADIFGTSMDYLWGRTDVRTLAVGE